MGYYKINYWQFGILISNKNLVRQKKKYLFPLKENFALSFKRWNVSLKIRLILKFGEEFQNDIGFIKQTKIIIINKVEKIIPNNFT